NNLAYDRHRAVTAETATLVGAPPEDFIRLWAETAFERNTGILPTSAACIEHICRTLGVEPSEDGLLRAAGHRTDYVRGLLKPRPGTVEVLRTLRERGHKTGLISDCTHEVPLLWAKTPFASLIDVPVFSCSAGLKKPDPRIYRLAASQLDVTPEDCLFIGDGGSQELSGARDVGMHPMLFRLDGDGTEPHLLDREQWDGPAIESIHDVLAIA
ncbi:MAG: HAD-IA family hydrolase, partial [Dehalococcoidales bacterium]